MGWLCFISTSYFPYSYLYYFDLEQAFIPGLILVFRNRNRNRKNNSSTDTTDNFNSSYPNFSQPIKKDSIDCSAFDSYFQNISDVQSLRNSINSNFLKNQAALYVWTNKLNGKQYVGSSSDIKTRLRKYFQPSLRGINTIIAYAILKYGFINFSLAIK